MGQRGVWLCGLDYSVPSTSTSEILKIAVYNWNQETPSKQTRITNLEHKKSSYLKLMYWWLYLFWSREASLKKSFTMKVSANFFCLTCKSHSFSTCSCRFICGSRNLQRWNIREKGGCILLCSCCLWGIASFYLTLQSSFSLGFGTSTIPIKIMSAWPNI